MDEEVFRALADPSRRALLDALRDRDGQALSELEEALPGMTRFGVMKHLRVLADAGLITTRRDGRRKLHFLNAVPIRLIYDRWVSKYTEPWAAALTGLKHELEKPMEKVYVRPHLARLEAPMTEPENVYEVEIATTPERLWKALTDPQETRKYWHGALSISDWQVGSRWTSQSEEGEVYLEGEILEIDPPRRLVHSFHIVHKPDAAAESPSRLEFEITPIGDRCRLTVVHTGRGPATKAYTSGGWETIFSGLKELLETGSVAAAAM